MPQLQLVASPQSHTEPAWSVAFNPKRNLLASCSTDKTVRLYSYALPAGEAKAPQQNPGSSPSTLRPAADSGLPFPSPTSNKAVFHHAKTIQTEHKRTIRSLAWAPSGKTLATGSFDSTVAIWEEEDGEGADGEEAEGQEGVYKPKAAEAEDTDMDDEDKYKSSTGGRPVKEWECVTTLEGHESECKAVGWSSDGALLGSSSRDKSVWVWEG
jgi:WD40 repeat protein